MGSNVQARQAQGPDGKRMTSAPPRFRRLLAGNSSGSRAGEERSHDDRALLALEGHQSSAFHKRSSAETTSRSGTVVPDARALSSGSQRRDRRNVLRQLRRSAWLRTRGAARRRREFSRPPESEVTRHEPLAVAARRNSSGSPGPGGDFLPLPSREANFRYEVRSELPLCRTILREEHRPRNECRSCLDAGPPELPLPG